MSLDVSLQILETVRYACCEQDRPLSPEGRTRYEATLTHNHGRMAKAAGLYEALWRPKLVCSLRISVLATQA